MKRTNEEPKSWWTELDRLARILGQVGPDEVCCEGLTPRQTSILRTLVESEGARLSDLADAADLSPSAMTRVIEKLELRGLVQRVRGKQPDGRAATVRITSEGRKVRASIDHLMSHRARTIIAAIPASQRSTILNSLKSLNTALEGVGCCLLNSPQLVQIRSKK